MYYVFLGWLSNYWSGTSFEDRLFTLTLLKQFDRNGLQGNREFLDEVLMLNLLYQTNLVNLIGYCADGDQGLLVYEFMPLGSLEDHLHGIVHQGEHFVADGDWRSISIYTVCLPNAAVVVVAKCGQPNKKYGDSSYMAYASLQVLCFNAELQSYCGVQYACAERTLIHSNLWHLIMKYCKHIGQYNSSIRLI